LENNIIFTEGNNDVFFLHEIFLNNLNMDSDDICIYKNQKKLNNDLRSNRNFKFSLLAIGGYTNCCKVPIIFSRYFWSDKIPIKFGVINDKGSGIAYDELKHYTSSYINDPRRVNKLKPNVIYNDSDLMIIYEFHHREDILIWNLLVPDSLEIQMYLILKQEHPELKQYNNMFELFKKAKEFLNLNNENLVRYCTNLFHGEGWYNSFVNSFSQRI